ncbi:MAG: sulfatase-like hydrolase/transferase [Planctomycetota bacterium]|nr:sulfatase-like hydrolase/transferase [Planctomycetota bacterium]
MMAKPHSPKSTPCPDFFRNVACLLAVGLSCLWLPGIRSCQAGELPNILWITSEDNGPHLGCYGDTYAVTPHLDALATRSMIFLHASSNAPVCAPARTTIISGLYPPATGAEHMRSQTSMPANYSMYPQFLRKAGYYCTNNSKEDYNLEKPGQVWDASGRKAHWKNRAEGQPFFAIFNHGISHESQLRNAIPKANQIHNPATVRIPAYHPDTPNVRRNWAQYHDRITMMDKLVARNLEEIREAGLEEDTIVFYYGDHGSGMPRSKRWPYNSGLHVPMIVHFPEKWKHLAPKEYRVGGSSDRLVGFIDLAPTLLSLAGIRPPNWMHGHAFAGKHQKKGPEYSYGFRGRMDERYDLVRSVRSKRYLYIRNYMPHKPYGQHLNYMFVTQTTQDWHRLFHEGKLNEVQSRFWKTKPAEELYDLQNDPDEVRNLVSSEEHREVLVKMRKAQRDWAKEIRDIGFLSEWEVHHRSKDSPPYALGRDPSRYDFDRVFQAAERATSLDEQDLPAILNLLQDTDSAVRYWGAIGLLCHGKKGYLRGQKALLKALEDKSPIVQVTAAEALGRYGSAKEVDAALKTLLRCAAPESDVYLGIAAWNALDHLDERARPVADQIRELSPTPEKSKGRVTKYSGRLKQKVMADLFPGK